MTVTCWGVCCLADTKAACFRWLVCSEHAHQTKRQKAFSFRSVHPPFSTASFIFVSVEILEKSVVYFLIHFERCKALFIINLLLPYFQVKNNSINIGRQHR